MVKQQSMSSMLLTWWCWLWSWQSCYQGNSCNI